MQRNLSNITSTTWAASITDAGGIVQDVDVIRQRWYTALTTPAGSVPLDPYFSSDIFSHIDKPASVSAPRIRAEILQIAKTYLPEVTVKSIIYAVSTFGTITYSVSSIVNGKKVTFDFTTADGLISFADYGGRLVLYSQLPLNASSIALTLTLDNKVILPSAPVSGFPNAQSALLWAQTNWASYGAFSCGTDVMVMVPHSIYSTGKITITAL